MQNVIVIWCGIMFFFLSLCSLLVGAGGQVYVTFNNIKSFSLVTSFQFPATSQQAAQTKCENLGGNLAKVASQREIEFIARQISRQITDGNYGK